MLGTTATWAWCTSPRCCPSLEPVPMAFSKSNKHLPALSKLPEYQRPHVLQPECQNTTTLYVQTFHPTYYTRGDISRSGRPHVPAYPIRFFGAGISLCCSLTLSFASILGCRVVAAAGGVSHLRNSVLPPTALGHPDRKLAFGKNYTVYSGGTATVLIFRLTAVGPSLGTAKTYCCFTAQILDRKFFTTDSITLPGKRAGWLTL